jgi:molybdopterin-containing oxidoreductase family membrane subunit
VSAAAAPLIIGAGKQDVPAKILAPLERAPRGWWLLLGASAALSGVLVLCITITLTQGIGTWGNNIPVGWAFGIINFVWWIGIGHAGTFISAFLLLMDQPWRASLNRVAEAMTIFALVNAGVFPLLHLGRPWFAYWLVPYPSALGVWPQFKSSLPWDVAAISTYFLLSALFWYLGLLPDLAAARDRVTGYWQKRVYGVLALGWRGAGDQWKKHRVAYLLLAGLATPLVVSVHSIVSLDFSIAQVPGWHSTIFPPFFVVGAIYSGFAMVLLLILPLRRTLGLEPLITERHLSNIASLMLAMGLMLGYAYIVEAFGAWYSSDPYERYTALVNRPGGPLAWLYWLTVAINVLAPQVFWSRRARRSTPVLIGVSALVLVGMWTERFTIIVGSLTRDFLPSSWHGYAPTLVDLGLLAGSLGLFGFLFLLFIRWLPTVSMSEVQRLQFQLHHGEQPDAGRDG